MNKESEIIIWQFEMQLKIHRKYERSKFLKIYNYFIFGISTNYNFSKQTYVEVDCCFFFAIKIFKRFGLNGIKDKNNNA